MIEPGRILVSRFGVYVAKVIDTKTAAGSSIAILDGGINHAMLPITANQYRIEVLNREQPKDAKPVTVGGPLCTSADQWRSQVPLDGVQVGDLIAMHNAGAYGLTASMTKFLSRETPAEVMLIDGRAHIIRERSNPADVLRGQSIPSEVQDD
jgi:diaminopimelate decarboxylase